MAARLLCPGGMSRSIALVAVLAATAASANTEPPMLTATVLSCSSNDDCALGDVCGGYRELESGAWSRGTCMAKESQRAARLLGDEPIKLGRRAPKAEIEAATRAGFHVVESPNVKLLTTGGAIFGAGYLATTGLGLAMGLPEAAIPFAGPIFTASHLWVTGSAWGLEYIANGFIVLLTGAELISQVAGAIVFMSGLANPTKTLVKDEGPSVHLVPGAAGAPVGASVTGRF